MKLSVYAHFMRPQENYSDQVLCEAFANMAGAGIGECWAFLGLDGVSTYRSKVYESPLQGDVLQRALEFAARNGVELHPVFASPRVFTKESTEKVPYTGNGAEPRSTACLSDEGNRSVALQAIEELLGYGVPGIHLDYIRYPNAGHSLAHPCECPACRRMRKEWWGVEVFTGKDLEKPGILFKEIEMRRSLLTSFLKEIREMTNRAGAKLGMAARASYASDALAEGQDWALWSREGLVDTVATMTYTLDHDLFASLVEEQARLLAPGQAEFWVTIGRASSAGRLTPDEMLSQIQVAQRNGAKGCAIFSLKGMTEADFTKLAALA